ncbi:MAG: GH25 family lysozyme [Anaerolineales bacterium]
MTELYDKLSMNGLFRVGLDGSAYQSVDRKSAIDWELAASQGVDFMIWRMSIGGYYKDLSFVPNMVTAAEAGIIIRGAYVVVRPDYDLASHMALIEQQFEELEQIENPHTPKPFIWLDVETYALKNTMPAGEVEITRRFTPEEINQRTIQVADAVKELQGGIEPGFYSYGDFVISKMGTETQKEYLERFKDRFWMAYYYTPFSTALQIDRPNHSWVPSVFYNPDHPLLGVTIWQFGSEANQNNLGSEFGGEACHFDVNRTHLTKTQLGALFSGDEAWPPSEDEGEGESGINIGEDVEDDERMIEMSEQEYQKIIILLGELKTGQLELKTLLQNSSGTNEGETGAGEDNQPLGDGRPTKWVTVTGGNAPLREVYKYNKAGRPVWGIYGKRVIANRIIAKEGKCILVYAKEIKGDGGHKAYEIVPGQIVDGHTISTDPILFVLLRHVSQ